MTPPLSPTPPARDARTNSVRLEDLADLPIGDIAALPPEILCDLQDAAADAAAHLKRLRERLEAGIAQRYGAQAEAARMEQGKSSGTVRVEDGDFVIVADLPKKVTWNQDHLARMALRIADAGEYPAAYLEITYRVPERRFTAWPDALRDGFAAARTETTAKPTFRLEPRGGR